MRVGLVSPIDRLEWLRAVVSSGAPGHALRVAVILAVHANSGSGEARPGLRNAVGVDVAKRGAAWLRLYGWSAIADERPGKATIYTLTRGTSAPGAPMHPVQGSTHTRGAYAPTPGAPVPPEPGIPGNEPGNECSEHSFKMRNGTSWKPSLDLIAKLTKANPDKDVTTEMERASLWLDTNPAKRKTASGMPRFLAGWLARADRVTVASDVDRSARELPPEMPDYIG